MVASRRAFWVLLTALAAGLSAALIAGGSAAPNAGAAGGPTTRVSVFVTDARFDPNPDASSWGRVTSSPAGIDCPGDCSEDFPSDTTIDLTRAPTAGYAFEAWHVFGNDAGPDCDKAASCSLALAQDSAEVTVEAAFHPQAELSAVPEGAGRLTIDPPEAGRVAADCMVEVPVFAPLPAACAPRYPNGTRVTVNAIADETVPGAEFVRWSDYRCPRTPSCTLTMRDATSLSAFFTPVYLNVWSGSFGDVTLTPPGARCTLPAGADPAPGDPPCQFAYELGSKVTLERDPAAGLNATDQWTGSCVGSGERCTLTMSKNELVRAGTDPTFDIPTPLGPPLKLFYSGPKGGTITVRSTSGTRRTVVCRNPKGCTTTAFTRYQRVKVRATAAGRTKFVRWADAPGFPARSPRRVTIGNRTAVKASFARR
jgi:hypothetical protein